MILYSIYSYVLSVRKSASDAFNSESEEERDVNNSTTIECLTEVKALLTTLTKKVETNTKSLKEMEQSHQR